jgi:hypothetical protein
VFRVIERSDGTSKPGSDETMDGLAGRIWWRGRREEGSLSLWMFDC